MESHEIEAHFANALQQVTRGNEPGVFIALLYAILTCVSESGGQSRITTSAFESRMSRTAGSLKRLDVYTILVQGISKATYETYEDSLESFRELRIDPEQAEDVADQIRRAIERVKAEKASQGRILLSKAVDAILSDDPPPS